MKKIFLFSTLALSLLSSGCAYKEEQAQMPYHKTGDYDKIVILHTNDVHAGIDDYIGYAGLAAYKKEMEEKYGADNVILVDAGDSVQGASVAMLTQGEAIVELMNAVDYDYFVLGNHEFDYQIPRMFELTNMMETEVVSSNFIDLRTNKAVFSPYIIHKINDIDIAFVGITTPESFTKVSVSYFQDEKGSLIYTFAEDKSGDNLYKNVQESVDKARQEGAEYVVALAHLGLETTSAPWRSTDLIANTTGIDIVLDGHSHSVIEGEIYKNKNNEDVILSQTGTKLERIGKVIIDPNQNPDNDIKAILFGGDGSYITKDAEVQALVDEINADFEGILEREVAYTDYELLRSNDTTELSRVGETNLGDLVTDAYRAILETDVAITNGGGIRANVDKGPITFREIIDLHPFGNNIISVEVSGKTIKDALEMASRTWPAANGGFLQVSGMTYEIDGSIPSSVKVNDQGNFISVDGAYRVKNITIGGKALDENKMYTLATHDYMIKKAGEGMTMFKDVKILKDMFMLDSEVLIKYFTENLNGKVGSEYAETTPGKRIKTYN